MARNVSLAFLFVASLSLAGASVAQDDYMKVVVAFDFSALKARMVAR